MKGIEGSGFSGRMREGWRFVSSVHGCSFRICLDIPLLFQLEVWWHCNIVMEKYVVL